MSGSVPRMRTLPEAAAEIRKMDESTAITLTAIRRMVKRGEVPAVEVGCKRLVNLDSLLEMLANPGSAAASGSIRKVL